MKPMPLLVRVATAKHLREVVGLTVTEIARRCRVKRPNMQSIVNRWGIKAKRELRGGKRA